MVVVTDHRPVVKVLGNRALEDVVNPRVYALKEKTLQYKFKLNTCQQNANVLLTSYPLPVLGESDATDEEQEEDLEVATAAATVFALAIKELIT